MSSRKPHSDMRSRTDGQKATQLANIAPLFGVNMETALCCQLEALILSSTSAQ